jgi:hypothetical protein
VAAGDEAEGVCDAVKVTTTVVGANVVVSTTAGVVTATAPVKTICNERSGACPGYEVATAVAQLLSPQPH